METIATRPQRIVPLNNVGLVPGPVVYWMSRDQRAQDNWALCYAQQLAIQWRQPLAVAFCLVDDFTNANYRHYAFMLAGLEETAADLAQLNIPFFLLHGSPIKCIPAFVHRHKVAMLVTDFDPLRIKQNWVDGVSRQIAIPFHEVDAHNIVPCQEASDHQEWAARTIRPKIELLLDDYLGPLPFTGRQHLAFPATPPPIDWQRVAAALKVDRSVTPVENRYYKPGPRQAHHLLGQFISHRLEHYDRDHNDPTVNGQSNLSPYLHFGQISAQRIAVEVQDAPRSWQSREGFLEQLIIRRELAENFCFYNSHYDDFQGLPAWGQRTILQHARDPRPHLYSLDQLDAAQSGDDLWNAAQREMLQTGKMHGYMRMYWAKKLLEWTATPQEAMERAIYLNDRYSLDGRDPNGYANILWSIGGLFDTPFPGRPIFGNVRCMGFEGCARKFNVPLYIQQYSSPPSHVPDATCWCGPLGSPSPNG